LTVRQHLSARKSEAVLSQLPFFETALNVRVADFFISRFPCGYKLRVLPEFGKDITYLDIETTGLDRHSGVTVIGLSRQGSVENYVRGRNLADFIPAWKKIGILLTFNGTRFDLPFLMREFGFTVHPPHIDLMREAKTWGLSGGLKAIEQQLKVTRNEEETGDGRHAVTLWNRFIESGDEQYLNRLIAYNKRDVQTLETLALHLWKLSFQNYSGPLPV
jgi:uncharacterized protein YprB with RNaseH-like and TPR domain